MSESLAVEIEIDVVEVYTPTPIVEVHTAGTRGPIGETGPVIDIATLDEQPFNDDLTDSLLVYDASSEEAMRVKPSNLGYTAPYTDSVLRTIRGKLGETVSITDFSNGVGEGNDDSSIFTAAIAALPSTGGKILLPAPEAGYYRVNSGLVINKHGVVFEGLAGSGGFNNNVNGIQIAYYGSSAPTGSLIRVGNQSDHIVGFEMHNIGLNGRGLIGHNLRLTDAQQFTIRGGRFIDATVASILVDNGSATSNPGGYCGLIDKVTVEQIGSGTNSADGIWLNGTQDAPTGMTGIALRQVRIRHTNGHAIRLSQADGYLFDTPYAHRNPGGTGYGIQIDGRAFEANNGIILHPVCGTINVTTFLNPGTTILVDGMPADVDAPVLSGAGAESIGIRYLDGRWKTAAKAVDMISTQQVSGDFYPRIALKRSSGGAFTNRELQWILSSIGYLTLHDNTAGRSLIEIGTDLSLGLHDTDASHFSRIKIGTNLSQDRTLTLTTGDANRNITLSGDPTLGDWFDQAVKATSSPTFVNPVVTSLEVGHATANTITGSAGDLSVEGNIIYRAGGTDVPVTDGGTGRSTGTTAYALVATGTTATGAQQSLAAGATTEVLVGGGASALPVWTTASGSGAPVRATGPTITAAAVQTTNTGLKVLDTNASHSLIVAAGEDYSADHTLSVKTGTGSTSTIWSNNRETLTADRTYYVRTDGSDSNTGLVDSSGGGLLTLQKAWDLVAALDMSIYTVTIQIRDGTYTAGFLATTAPLGLNPVLITGNASTPANVHLSKTAGSAPLRLDCAANVKVTNLKASHSANHIVHINHPGARMEVAGGFDIGATNSVQFFVLTGMLKLTGTHALSGGGANYIEVRGPGYVEAVTNTTVLTASVTYTQTTARCGVGGVISDFNHVFTLGAFTVTAERYNASENALIKTFGGGASYYPGNVAGTTATGGQYT